MSTSAHAKKKHHAPKFNPRYNCSKAAQTKIVNAFLASWEGHLAIKGKVYNSASAHGGSSACTYEHAEGPFAGQWAGSLYIEYGSKAARSYAGTSTRRRLGEPGRAPTESERRPRACGPVEIAGVGTHAYEAFFYIATLKKKVFVRAVDPLEHPAAAGCACGGREGDPGEMS